MIEYEIIKGLILGIPIGIIGMGIAYISLKLEEKSKGAKK
jgi:Na+/H+ antiporter NhaA